MPEEENSSQKKFDREAWRKDYMKRYNAKRAESRRELRVAEYDKLYRDKPFLMNPREPRILTLSDVAHLFKMNRAEAKEFAEELPVQRLQNGYPRYHCEAVFQLAEKKGLEGDRLQGYKEELARLHSLKDRDPEAYYDLCDRLANAREAQKERRSRPRMSIPHQNLFGEDEDGE